MRLVECVSIFGNRVKIPAEKLRFRPSVYAIIRDEGHVLLLTTRSTGEYCLPGGGVEIGEPMEEALQREVREERKPRWRPIAELDAGDFQSHGDLIMDVLRSLHA